MKQNENFSEGEKIMALINAYEEEGKTLAKKAVAKNLLDEGLDSHSISKLTGLDSLEIIELMDLPISYVERGKTLGKQEVAIEMLKSEFNLEFISEVTEIEIEKLEKMKKQQ